MSHRIPAAKPVALPATRARARNSCAADGKQAAAIALLASVPRLPRWLALLPALVLACQGAAPSGPRSGYESTAPERAAGGEAGQALFADERLADYALEITREAFAEVAAKPNAPPVSVGLTAAGAALAAPVGFRARDGGAFELIIDHVDPRQRLFGVARIELHPFVADPSLFRERIAYQLFREMGLPAPRSAHARLSVGGAFRGLYLAVEAIDRGFLEDRWPGAGEGNLYGDIWPGIASPSDPQRALRAPDRADHRAFVAFNNLVKAARPRALARLVDEWLDLPHLTRFLATDAGIGNRGGVRAFACDESGRYCSNRDFFLYQDERSDRFWLLPSNLWRVLRPYDPTWRMPRWTEAAPDCGQRTRTSEGEVRRAPGCDRIFAAVAENNGGAMAEARQRLLEVWTPGKFTDAIDRWAKLMELAVASDESSPGLPAWRLAIKELKRDLDLLRSTVGTDAAPEGEETVALGRTSFEGLDRATFLARTEFIGARRSGGLHELNTVAPLSGTHDVLLEFELANDVRDGKPVPYSQAAAFRLPFRTGTTLSDARRIRFLFRTSLSREVTVAVEGSRPLGGIRNPRIYATVAARAGAPAELVLELANFNAELEGAPISAEARAAILAEPAALLFQIEPIGLTNGLLPAGNSDAGLAQLDNVFIQ